MFGSSGRRAATASSWAMAVRCSSESNSGVVIMALSSLTAGPGAQPEHDERPAIQIVDLAGAVRPAPVFHVPSAGVEHGLPAHARVVAGEDEGDALVVGVQEEEEGIVDDGLPHVVDLLDGVTGQPAAAAAQ